MQLHIACFRQVAPVAAALALAICLARLTSGGDKYVKLLEGQGD